MEMQNNKTSYNHINFQVYNLLEDLYAIGEEANTRGLKTKEANLVQLEIDPLYSVLEFKDRLMNWKYYTGELAWYIMKDTNVSFINNFSSFWKDNVADENGQINSNYGNILFNKHPGAPLTTDIEKYKRGNQLEWIFNSLVKDKDSRQAIGFFNSPQFQYEGNKDFVCTMYINFWIRKDTLYMKVQMRSNDIFFGLSYDAPWFSTVFQSMHLNLKKIYPNLMLGTYFHCADNIHFYERHFNLVDKILSQEFEPSTRFELKYPIFSFYPQKFNVETNERKDYQLELSEEALNFVTNIKFLVKGKANDEAFKQELLTLYNIQK